MEAFLATRKYHNLTGEHIGGKTTPKVKGKGLFLEGHASWGAGGYEKLHILVEVYMYALI